MKADALTTAAAIFIFGLVVSSLGLTEVFSSEPEAPTELQRGFSLVSD